MLLLKFVLAFCGLAYELVMAQALSAFLDNTVLRYSTTIGLYMFSMGLGALASGRIDARRSAVVLWQVEILLAIAGAGGFFGLFVLSGANAAVVVIGAYALVAVIGYLTGMELPLLLMLAAAKGTPSRSALIGMDYAGACLATLVFVFYFYPAAGLVRSVLLVVLVNVLAAMAVAVRFGDDVGEDRFPVLVVTWVLLGGVMALLVSSGQLALDLAAVYIGQGR